MIVAFDKSLSIDNKQAQKIIHRKKKLFDELFQTANENMGKYEAIKKTYSDLEILNNLVQTALNHLRTADRNLNLATQINKTSQTEQLESRISAAIKTEGIDISNKKENNSIEIAYKKRDETKNHVGIFDFTGHGLSANDLSAFTSRFYSELFKTQKFIIVERAKMEEILKEQGFQLSGCTTNDCMVEAGRIMNVNYMIGGSISSLGDYYLLDFRMVDVETGEIISIATENIKGNIDKVILIGIPTISQKL